MKVTINNIEKTLPDGLSLEEVIDEIGYQEFKLAVAINNQIVSKASWSDTVLHDGDKIIIIKAVSGG